MKRILLYLIASLFLIGAKAQTPNIGPCPTSPVPQYIKWDIKDGIKISDTACFPYITTARVAYIDANGSMTSITDAALAARIYAAVAPAVPTLWEVTHKGDSTDRNIEAPGFIVNSANKFIGTTGNYGFGERVNNTQIQYTDSLGNKRFYGVISIDTFIRIGRTNPLRIWKGRGNGVTNDGSVGIGSNALLLQNGGNANIAIGGDAGGRTTTGSDNCFFGSFGGYGNTTGSNNIAIGKFCAWGAGSQRMTGGGNVIIGPYSGQYISDSLNVMIGGGSKRGVFAGGSGGSGGNANGSYNTYLGARSGNIAFNATTPNLRKNTFIGYNTGSSCTTGDSNNIAIGYNVTLSGGSRNRLSIADVIYGTNIHANNAKIGIKKAVPLYGLDINSTFGVNRDSLPTATNADSMVMVSADGQFKKRPALENTVYSGTYTPTFTNTTNVAASTPRLCTYYRVGNSVTIAGQFEIDPTLTAVSTVMGISLPVASNFTTLLQAGGTASAIAIASESGGIISNATSDYIELIFIPVDLSNHVMTFTATYTIY